ncbi:MAG: metallophosphoesterase [Nitrososphaeria archaeon]
MTNRNLSILYDDAALILKTKKDKFLCVADLHLGYSQATSSVLLLDQRTLTSLASMIVDISKRTQVKNLVLLGDLKHSIARVTYLDRKLINQFFGELNSSFKTIYLILGNHDGSMKNILPNYVITIRKGILLNNAYLMHGHTLPGPEILKSNLIVMGHLHPTFYKERSPLNGQRIWILMTLYLRSLFPNKEVPYNLVIMPSFNPETSFPLNLSYSSDFSSRTSPLLNRCRREIVRIKTISLDGTVLTQEQ